ncbi:MULTISPECIES: high light inducible protein [unclassified Prochlorococcus]|uniref:high light inducible protein n=1 Tax=unclassified Prochlorococcus TaxID=2627481 RepID=UPI00053390F7|nr:MULTISPECIES: high light inducible protein [unclassified Prochlorococcus]KGG15505.1 putative high light inducible protein [Prochlorococcus sp. MIT 0602]KGG17786.1 putative high light inducible protein [Prochlorococcus sp. MIT 0603]
MTTSSSTQITTESGNRQNIFPVEAQPQLIENYSGYGEDAEKANGRWAMIGFIALLGAYLTTGQIIPGIF